MLQTKILLHAKAGAVRRWEEDAGEGEAGGEKLAGEGGAERDKLAGWEILEGEGGEEGDKLAGGEVREAERGAGEYKRTKALVSNAS